jgi:hypothetical protein
MIKEIGNKYTPEELKDKINELIRAQKHAKNDKKCYKRSDMCYGVDTSKIENKQSKLDEYQYYRNAVNTNGDEYKRKEQFRRLGELADEAIDEIIQQKDEEIFRLKSAIIDQSNNFRNERNQREKEYEILKQQNPKIDDDLKKWLKSWNTDRFCKFSTDYTIKENIINMEKLLKILI